MVQEGLAGIAKQSCKLRPGVRGAHIHDPNSFDAWLRRLDAKEARGLATFNSAPELPLGGDDQVLVQRIGMGSNLDPFAATGDHREHRTPGRDHPHIMLQLRHVLFGRCFFRERPGQHKFGLEDRPGPFDLPVERRRHPAQHRMADMPLNIGKNLAGITKLDYEIARQIFRLDLATLLSPEANERSLVIAHNGPSIGASYEVAPLTRFFTFARIG